MRLGDDHRHDQLIRLALQTAGCDSCSYATNNYSAMLAFQCKNGGDYLGMAGIRSMNAESNTIYSGDSGQGGSYAYSELHFMSLIPQHRSQTNGGFGMNTTRSNTFLIGDKTGAHFPQGVFATNGVASYSVVAAASIAATGWTNIWSTNNATVYVTASPATAITIKNRANTTLYTISAQTNLSTILLQPGWGFSASGNLSGTAVPF